MALWERVTDAAQPEQTNWDSNSQATLDKAVSKASSTPFNLRDTDTFKILEQMDAAASNNLERTATMEYLNTLEL